MKYNGIELKEFKSDKAVLFDPPKMMLVWDCDVGVPTMEDVYAYIPNRTHKIIGTNCDWLHCAEIPEEPKPRRATNRELAKWLAQGNGEYSTKIGNGICSQCVYNKATCYDICSEHIVIRKWEDTEWHEPTANYMGLED